MTFCSFAFVPAKSKETSFVERVYVTSTLSTWISEPLKQDEMPLVLRVSPAKICAGKKPRTSQAAPEERINRMSTVEREVYIYTKYISQYTKLMC